jgi:hypothetical protein
MKRDEILKALLFQSGGQSYRGESAIEIVRGLERAAADYPYRGQSIRQFLLWSLDKLGDKVHPRELDLSDRLDEEALAFSYLCLCDEYDAGELIVE